MQNEKKYIRYKGITRLPSEHDSFDGELEDVVNMALTGGELRPVLPPELIGTIQGQFMFVHKNQGFEHFIYLDGNVIKAYKHESGTLTQIACNINIGTSFLKSLDAIGNTLIILTNKDILYALWKPDTNNYLNLGSDIPFPVIQFALESVDLGLYATSASFEINQDNAGERNYFNLIKETAGTDVESDMDTGTSFIPKAFANDLPADQLEAKNKITNRVAGEINKYLKFALDSKAHMFPFFVRYAIRLYDGTLVKHSPLLLMLPSKFIPFRAGPYNLNEVTTDSNQLDRTIDIVFSDPSRLKYKPTSVFPQLFSDIVESVDIFISGPIYTFVQDMDLNGSITYDPPYENAHRFGGLYKSKNAVLKQITETSTFFKVASLPIDDMGSTSMLSYVPMDDLSTLLNQEVMTDDYRSHEKVIAETSFTYNHKLHLSGVKRRPFYGFKYGSGGNYYSIQNYGTVMANQIYSFDSQPYIFHPDPNAKEMITVASAEEYRLKLTEHKGLNGSFYLDPELSSPYLGVGIAAPEPLTTDFIPQQSTLFISAHQNPFVFPASSRITLPVGEIIAVASNTEAISQGQFGQFPLYAFTDDGIWALEVGNDGKYTARQPVSREVATNSNIMQMDKALAFITAKGVSLLSGQNTEHISEIIRENNRRGSKLFISSILTALDSGGMQSVYNMYVPFETFTAGATLAFDHITGSGRIIVINPLYSYAYVFDIGSSSWSKIIASYKRVVNNYPDCYVQDGAGVIYNLAHIPDALDSTTDCMFITRPIKYNDLNFVIRSLSHRGIFKSVLNVGVYASRNGQDYHLIKTGKEKLIRMTGSGYMYYKILVIANLKSNEVISGIDLDFMVKYSNRMR